MLLQYYQEKELEEQALAHEERFHAGEQALEIEQFKVELQSCVKLNWNKYVTVTEVKEARGAVCSRVDHTIQSIGDGL